jgi:DNA ligase-1
VLLADVVAASRAAAATRSRLAKTAAVADALRAAGPEQASTVAAYLSGVLPQRRVGVSWRGLTSLPRPADSATATVAEVDDALSSLAAVGGAGSAAVRQQAVADLFARLTADEQDYLRNLITGQVRQGALDGVMLAASAAAAQVTEPSVRRAVMLAGYAGPVAEAALRGGEQALTQIGLEVGRPLRPMLAASAPDVASAWDQVGAEGAAYVDGKLDGIRLQAHRDGDDVRLFTRSLDDITDRLPEVVEAVLALPALQLVIDGEAIALDPSGRPRPFQETASRTMSSSGVEALRAQAPVTPYFFDLLHVDGVDLLDSPATERFDKPRHTLDLVVLAVEWGSGRRQGWLSNIHLGARDPQSGDFVMLGKTFKGMTDEMLAWQTERFTELATEGTAGYVVPVRPEQVVEIAFDGIQTSSRYPGGMALRFARVLRYRDDKTADEADTIETVRALHP